MIGSKSLCMFCALLSIAKVAGAEETLLEQTLNRVRTVLQAEALVKLPKGLKLSGTSNISSVEAEVSLVFDDDGRFVRRIGGDLPTQSGFDGEVAWSVDSNNTFRVLELGDRDQRLLSLWLLTGQWVFQPNGLMLETPRKQGQEMIVPFRLGHFQGTITLDGQSSLPLEAQFQAPSAKAKITLKKYSMKEGYRLPSEVMVNFLGSAMSFRFEKTEKAPGDFLYEMQAPPLDDVEFDIDVPPELEVQRAQTGHLLVKVAVNEEREGWFIFDTGAGANCLSEHAAQSLGLDPIGTVTAQGIGGNEPSRFYRLDSIRVGPLTQTDHTLVGIDLGGISSVMGAEIDGIVGYDLLSRCVVHFDQVAPRIELYEHTGYRLDRGKWDSLVLYKRQANVRAQFEGHQGLFTLDTGAAGSGVSLHQRTVRDLKLLESREHFPAEIGGVGGVLPARSGQLRSFRVGHRQFENVSASFAIEEKGAFHDSYTAGNIGGEVLKSFCLVFDYRGRRIAFLTRDLSKRG